MLDAIHGKWRHYLWTFISSSASWEGILYMGCAASTNPKVWGVFICFLFMGWAVSTHPKVVVVVGFICFYLWVELWVQTLGCEGFICFYLRVELWVQTLRCGGVHLFLFMGWAVSTNPKVAGGSFVFIYGLSCEYKPYVGWFFTCLVHFTSRYFQQFCGDDEGQRVI